MNVTVWAIWLLQAAAAEPSSVELFGGLSLWFSRVESTFDASYTPSRVNGIGGLFVDPDPRSNATQLLRLEGDRSGGLGLGANVFPHRVLGFQFLVDRAEVGLSGESPPHDVEITYDSIAFPSSEPVVRHQDYSFDSSGTEGALDELAFSFNAVARFGATSAAGGSVSGGLTYFRFEGEAERLGAFAAWLGGHAVLFSELYEMSYSLAAEDAIGFNLGGTLDVSLGEHAAVFVDGRYLYAPETETDVRLSEFRSENVVSVPLARVEEFLDLPAVAIDPGYFRILFGAKVKL